MVNWADLGKPFTICPVLENLVTHWLELKPFVRVEALCWLGVGPSRLWPWGSGWHTLAGHKWPSPRAPAPSDVLP